MLLSLGLARPEGRLRRLPQVEDGKEACTAAVTALPFLAILCVQKGREE